jgi:hypothetical protein
MTNDSFAKTIAAALTKQRTNMELGDALIEECGPPGETGIMNGSIARLECARLALEEAGIEYATNSLRMYRDVASVFPPALRYPQITWSLYKIFQGYPQLLHQWVEFNPGKSMTVSTARRIVERHKTPQYDEPKPQTKPAHKTKKPLQPAHRMQSQRIKYQGPDTQRLRDKEKEEKTWIKGVARSMLDNTTSIIDFIDARKYNSGDDSLDPDFVADIDSLAQQTRIALDRLLRLTHRLGSRRARDESASPEDSSVLH